MIFLSNLPNKSIQSSVALLSISLMTLTGCQSLHATNKPMTSKPVVTSPVVTPQPNSASPTVSRVNPKSETMPVTDTLSNQQFSINGKIGITTPKQSGSAFYVWSQQGQNFAIELAGALNAGQTKIGYNGQSATLTNDKGTINAATPEELLQQATGWQAPISQLPYWIQGQPAPSDNNDKKDNYNRLVNAQNGEWNAEFSYANNSDKLPSRLTARHPAGYKVVMTINRLAQ